MLDEERGRGGEGERGSDPLPVELQSPRLSVSHSPALPLSPSSRFERSPLAQLILSRLREFYREPEAVFWVYGFPIFLIVILGIAFRNKPVERIAVDVEAGPHAEAAVAALGTDGKFVASIHNADECRQRLRTGRTGVIIAANTQVENLPHEQIRYDYFFDPGRPESVLARNAVDDALQRAAGRKDVAAATNHELNQPGGRYIDFLVPGLLGMSLMGGGLWGVGFATVDMRLRKLLKRFLATPMRKSHFLAGIMISRLVFMVPEVLVMLIFSRLAFGVVIQGSLGALLLLILLGAGSFAGIGLLVASRANTLETVSGLMNLVMLPMWVLSGIFFSSDQFPDLMQPLIKVLPLTLLIDALRGVMLEGESLAALVKQVGLLAVWGICTFALALRWFRWN